MRVVFAGTPEFAKTALQLIDESGFEVPLVLTQPDRAAGRGMQLQESPVKQYAIARGIPVIQPTSLKVDGKFAKEAQDALDTLKKTSFDVIVVAAYGLILPQEVFNIAEQDQRHGCLNIHASLLPRWRGAAPIQRAIESGDAETGISIMQMDLGLDTGAIISKEAITLISAETTLTLHERLAQLGSQMIVDVLKKLEAKIDLKRIPQTQQGVTYANKILKNEAKIDWLLPAKVIDQRIRAFNPFPGSTFEYDGQIIKVWMSQIYSESFLGQPGLVLKIEKDGPIVATGTGCIKLLELQKPGGKRGPASQVCQALGVVEGKVLGIEGG